jgi:hypothetical protein
VANPPSEGDATELARLALDSAKIRFEYADAAFEHVDNKLLGLLAFAAAILVLGLTFDATDALTTQTSVWLARLSYMLGIAAIAAALWGLRPQAPAILEHDAKWFLESAFAMSPAGAMTAEAAKLFGDVDRMTRVVTSKSLTLRWALGFAAIQFLLTLISIGLLALATGPAFGPFHCEALV